ncbi:MAG: hypothetical protein ACJ761_09975, partial [Chloroflexota bacterium]
ELLRDRRLAARLGQAGREVALARFGIDRFARDWQAALDLATGHRAAPFVEAVAGMQPAAGVEAATGTAVGRS